MDKYYVCIQQLHSNTHKIQYNGQVLYIYIYIYIYNNYTQTLTKFNTMDKYYVCMSIYNTTKKIRLILLSFLKDDKEEEKGLSNGGEFQTVRAWN